MKEIEYIRRQLSAAMKTISTLTERHEHEQKEHELTKRKLNTLELRFVSDTQKINSLESKCSKYK